jgi:hypothetical protein
MLHDHSHTTNFKSAVCRFSAVDRDTLAALNAARARRVHGIHVSFKMGRSVPYRTLLERDLVHLLETDPKVRSFEHWPEKVVVFLLGNPQPHVPAFRVTSCSRLTMVLDVMSARDAADPVHLELTELVRRAYADRGIKYKALSQRQVSSEPQLSNARRILAARGAEVPQATLFLAERALSQGNEPRTVADIEQELDSAPGASDAVFLLALRGRVNLDLSAPEPSAMNASLRKQGGYQ